MTDGSGSIVAFVKADCPTCQLVAPLLKMLAASDRIAIYSQDDPDFPEDVGDVIDDRSLEASFRRRVDIVPTLIRLDAAGEESERVFGWNRAEWRAFLDEPMLGDGMPENRPGCGAKNQDPGVAEVLQATYGELPFVARRIEVDPYDDPIEQAFERGWTDGLPVTPPTGARILRMLSGTARPPDDAAPARRCFRRSASPPPAPCSGRAES